MNKLTQFAVFTLLLSLITASLIANKRQAESHTTPPTPQAVNPIWFNTIQISEGIVVEFEYGQQLQVFVEGDKQQLALVLENQVLKTVGKSNGANLSGIKIRVVTPVLISLAMLHAPTHTTNG